MKKVLSIAGSDSGGGAGIQQDLRVFSSFGCYGSTVVTVVTAQNTLGVQDYYVLPEEVVSAQLDSVLSDILPDAVKIGILPSRGLIDVVREALTARDVKNIVVDPVISPTSGKRFLEADAVASLRELCGIATLVTPNVEEAELLSGIPIRSREDMEEAAKRVGNCLVTGGHINTVDVLCYGGETFHIKGREMVSGELHGTGCAYSAAIASCLAMGFNVVASVGKAKRYLGDAVYRNFEVGSGAKVIDTAGIKLGRVYDDPEKSAVVDCLEAAIERFTGGDQSHKLIPQVGSNIAMALAGAKTISDVAGLSGRLVRDRDRVVPVGEVYFGGSSNMGRVALTALGLYPDARSVMNLRVGVDILDACEGLGFTVSCFDRDSQLPDAEDLEHGTRNAIEDYGRMPDAVYDKGGICKEPMVRLFGPDALSVVEKALMIAEKI